MRVTKGQGKIVPRGTGTSIYIDVPLSPCRVPASNVVKHERQESGNGEA